MFPGQLIVDKEASQTLGLLCLASAFLCKTVFINAGYKPSATHIHYKYFRDLPCQNSLDGILSFFCEQSLICHS